MTSLAAAALGIAIALPAAPALPTGAVPSLLVSARLTEATEAPLAERHQKFLDATRLLMTETEREVFLQLTADYRRDAFMRRFWRTRDPYPETARNELLDRWEQNTEMARTRYDDLADGRAQFLILHGPPDRRMRSVCHLLRSMEIWHYAGSSILPHNFAAIFLRRGGRYDLWSPSQRLSALAMGKLSFDDAEALREIEATCSRGSEIVSAITLSPDWEHFQRSFQPPGGDEWAKAFLDRSLDAVEAEDAPAAPDAPLEVAYVGRHQSRTVVRSMMRLDPQTLRSVEVAQPAGPAREIYRLLVDGEVVRGEELFETFRYRFELPRSLGERAGVVPVQVDRYLRPGRYTLRLRARDLLSDRTALAAADLDVPRVPAGGPANGERFAEPGSPPPTPARRPARGPATPEDGMAPVEPTVRLRVPNDELITGHVRVEALADGPGIDRVAFELDGRRLLSKGSPPYSYDIDVGRAPRRRSLRAVALDASGGEIASDEIVLNAGPSSFRVRLVEPQAEAPAGAAVRAAAEVDVPVGESLDRVEFYLNDERMATLYQPPFVQPFTVPADTDLAYVRAVAFLREGGAAEDVVFVNAPDHMDRVDVDLVELYVTATDKKGRFVEDLSAADFVIREDGARQEPRRFELVRDMPVHACVLLDTSTSMEDRIEEAEAAAQHFFETVLGEEDRACLVTFNDSHELTVPFTGRPEVLAGGLTGLETEGETALYDSLIHTLYYFNGLRGKRALILLSDGADSSSDYDYDEVMEFARRSGVAIYTIGLAIDHRDIDIRAKLRRFATETGGDSFFIESARELRRIYDRVERELRSQYLVAYQSTADSEKGGGDRTEDAFREIEIDVDRRGVRVRTQRGYYP